MSELILPAGVEVAVTGPPEVFPPVGHGMIVNETDLPDRVIETYIEEHASVLGLSPGNTYATYIAQGSLLTRPKFRVPTSVMEEIILARDLAERDDDVAATIGAMLALAFGDGMQHAHEDDVAVAMWDKIGRKAKMLMHFKELYREYLIAAQVTTAAVMTREQLSFTPAGADRQRTRSVLIPQIGVIPAEQIRVLGNDLFGTASLAYRPFSGRQENWLIEFFGERTTAARKAEMRREDPILTMLLTEMVEWGNQREGGAAWVYGDPLDPVIGHFVFVLNPAYVSRTCMPKGQWAHPRPLLTRNFPLLEAKRLLSIMDYCVPLDTTILTRSGWKHHDEAKIGEETLGYNPQTGRNEWTKITGVHHGAGEIVEMSNAYWGARSTPKHRWYATWKSWNYDGREYEGFVSTEELVGKKYLKLTAPAAGGGCELSPQEAAVIAWIVCDGNVYEHATGAWTTHVYQSKPVGRREIEAVLAGVPHRDYAKKQPAHLPNEMRTYVILGSYVRGLFERAGLGRGLQELPQLMLRLSPEARDAFLHACQQAEGWMNGSTPCLAQNRGPVLEAMMLCSFLCGERPSVRKQGGDGGCMVVSRNLRTTVKADKLVKRSLGVQPVWCVQTELGSWTMRQGDTISLTGNSLLEAGANFLVVAKKGTDQRPALPEEVANLRDTLKRATRSGVIIGDHRLSIEIITPQLDELLNPAKRKLIGRKLATAILRLPDFQSADAGSGQSVLTDTEIISRVVTSDREDLRSHVEQEIYEPTADRNGDTLAGPPTIWFPKIILQGLQFFTQLILGLRDRGDIPRQYAVEAAGFNYRAAVQARKAEKAAGDDRVLTVPPVPFSTPTGSGAGGRPPGSGPDNGAAGARPSNEPATAPNRNGRPPSRANEEVRAMLDENTDRVHRAGERTFAILESFMDSRSVGRLTSYEHAALKLIGHDPWCGPISEGPFTVLPVNPEHELDDIHAVRLQEGASMLVGRRVDDDAVLARALVFREPRYSMLDAEETALRWGFEVARASESG